jgi:type II secretory pathway pseudopilin PulG
LIEVAVVTIIVGIMAAIATPSMVGMKARSDLKDAMGQVKGALQEAQRAAIKQGASCTVNLGPSTGSTSVTGSPVGCITSPVTFSDQSTIKLWYNGSGTNIVFSFRGNTTSSRTMVLESERTVERKCIVIASGIGILRTGSYKNKVELPTLGTLDAGNCGTSL